MADAPVDPHAAAEGAGAFPPFDASLFPHQIFWFAVSFVALYVLMSRVALPHVASVIAARASAVKSDLDAAAKASAAAETAREAAARGEAEARARARETIEAMRAQAQAEFAAEQAKLDAALAQRIEAAEARIAGMRRDAMAEIATVAASLARDIAARVTGGVVVGAAP
jgi:F-type H+-transporting ATPase subunit b